MTFYNNSNSTTTTTLSQSERDSVSHDEIAKNLKNLAKASDNYYASYLKLCKAREDLVNAEQEVVNMEQLCIKAKNDYDHVMSKN
jgi:hypothetical protein